MQTTPRLIEPSNTPSSAETSVDLILPEHAHLVWPVAGPLLAPAIALTDGCLSLESAFSWICAGSLQLWLARDHSAAMVTEVRTFPTGKRMLHIVVLGGKELDRLRDLLPKIERWAAERGCVKVTAMARRGLAHRLSDWKATKVSIEKDIAHV